MNYFNSKLFAINKWLLSLFILVLFYTFCKFVFYPTSYIGTIDVKTYSKQQVESILIDFNNLAKYEIFKFTPGIRVINIIENDVILEKLASPREGYFIAGMTFDGILSCNVYLSSKLIEEQVRLTILHEVAGHCFGFRHTSKENDLMAPQQSDTVSEENISLWANKVKSRLKFWKIF